MIDSWMLVAGGVAAMAVLAAASWFRRREEPDLGTVSHQWISEQRFGHERDPRR